MPRVKEFEPDAVLGRALELFWERGYEATSMADLVEHLGVNRASLYATFGDKHELYLRALERYREVQNPVDGLSQPGPALPAVRELVESYVEQAEGDLRRRGCMIVNAAIESAPSDPDVAKVVSRGWQAMEVALTSALTRARAQGELTEDRDPVALARFLVVVLQGIKVVGRGEPDLDRIRAAADQAMTLLR